MRVKAVIEAASAVLVAVASVALLYVLIFRGGGQQAGASPAIQDAEGTIAAERLTNATGSGPVAIVEFMDFQCPYCAKHASTVLPALKASGVRYAVVNYPLNIHPQAIPAAEAAECAAEQGKYWEMHGLLFEDQDKLAAAELAHFSGAVSVFGANLDQEKFEACLQADQALAKVMADLAEAERLKVPATPTLFIGRVRSDGGVDLVKQIRAGASAEQLLEEVGKLKKG